MSDINLINDFLTASPGKLTPPEKWPQIPEAAQIIASSLLAGKKMAIWGDYDVDGITATAISLDILEFHGFSPMYHLPDRRGEGYGLNIPWIENLARQGCGILLTVDCGISDRDVIARASELGITVVVSDHHLPPQTLPDAAAIVNPRMENAGIWPCRHLSGVGVAFYLMAQVNNLLAAHTGKHYKMGDALDLVALGTLADVMTLDGENRILVRSGLARMAKTTRPGMAALKQAANFDMAAQPTSGQAVFLLAPRINAAGRMGKPDLALDLLRSSDYQQASRLADRLNQCNADRKSEEARMHQEARKQALNLLENRNYAALVLFAPDWHPGIVGIVASRIVEEFNRPAIVLCEEQGAIKGSGRSVADFDLYAGLEETAALLLGFGGHKMAAGVRLAKENLGAFRESFDSAVRKARGDSLYVPAIYLDDELDFSQAQNTVFLDELGLMQPFGPGNTDLVFVSPKLKVERRSFIGNSMDSVKLSLKDTKSGRYMTAKAWRKADEFPPDLVGKNIIIAYTPKVSNFRGLPEIEVTIKDWRPADRCPIEIFFTGMTAL